jgi:hypothetical protein
VLVSASQEAVLTHVREGMVARGMSSLKGLGLAFKRTDWDNSGHLERKGA